MGSGSKVLVEGNLAVQDSGALGPLQTEAAYADKPVYDFFKRAFDIAFSLAALAVLGPILLALMLMIYISDGGSPIFTQERPGKNGRLFKMYKLRTMVVGAEKKREEVLRASRMNVTAIHKFEDDPRITRLGVFLRKSSFDELLQLFNVLKGDMSIVGPRPLIPREHDILNQYFPIDRSKIKPGLSCYTVLDKHCRDSYENWVNLDMQYIRERSFCTDFKIIFKTIVVVILCKNA